MTSVNRRAFVTGRGCQRASVSARVRVRFEMSANVIRLAFAILAASSCCFAASAIAASDAPLRAPFDVEAVRAAKGRSISIEVCPESVPPISDVEGVPFYSDPQGSQPDPAKLAANEAATRPLDLFLAGVVTAANRWVASRPARPEAAACALRLLTGWADARAMLGRVNQQGSYHRKWTLAGA